MRSLANLNSVLVSSGEFQVDEFWSNSTKQPAMRERSGTGWTSFASQFPSLRTLLWAEKSRWFLWLPVLLSCGIAAYFSLPVEPPVWAIATLATLMAVFVAAAARGTMSVVVALSLAAFLAGVCAGKVRTMTGGPGSTILPFGVVTVEGWLERVDLRSGSRGYRFFIVPTQIETVQSADDYPVRISIIWRGPLKTELRPGDHVQFRAKFLAAPGPVWPGGYDPGFVRWFRGIGGGAFALQPPTKTNSALTPPTRVMLAAQIEGVRLGVAQRIRSALAGTQAAIAVALVTGDRSTIPEMVRDNLREAGLAHLLAISGLHMALFAGGVFWLVRAVLALNRDLALHRPIKKWAAGAALLAATGYLFLAGAGLATQRAFIMITIMFVAVMIDRPAMSMRNVAMAALGILLFRPESVLSVSFQLSFLAVIALVAMYEFLQDRKISRLSLLATDNVFKRLGNTLSGYFWGVGLTTLIAGIATTPVAAFHFNRVAVFGLLGNLLAVPVVGVLVMPAAIVALIAMPFGLEGLPLAVMGQGVDFVVWVAAAVSGLPGAVRMVPQMPTSAGLCLIFGVLWLCLWRGRWRLFGLAPVLLSVSLAPLLRDPPTIIVADRAKQVAVLGPQGELVFSSKRAGKYAAERWLLKFGDPASFKQAVERQGFSCDRYGCTITLEGMREVAVVKHPAILAEECARATVVIATFAFKQPCPAASRVITTKELRQKGVHALWLEKPQAVPSGERSTSDVKVVTARDRPGDRPWTAPPRRYRKKRSPKPEPVVPETKPNAPPAPGALPSPPLQVRI